MRSTVLGGLQTSFGGPGGPVGVQGGQGASWEGLGGLREVLGGSRGELEKRDFHFSRGEFVNCLMKH